MSSIRSGARNRAIVGFGSQAEAGSSSSGGTGSSRNRRNQNGTANEDEEVVISDSTEILINTAIRYVLFYENQNKPIARADVNKFLTEHHLVDRATFNLIMKELKKRLDDIFGYKMVEVGTGNFMLYNMYTMAEVNIDQAEDLATAFEDVELNLIDENEDNVAGTQQNGRSARSGNRRAVIQDSSDAESSDDQNTDDDDDEPPLNEDSDNEDEGLTVGNTHYNPDDVYDHAKRGLLMTILSLIYMNEYPLPEGDLFESLAELGLHEEYKMKCPNEIGIKIPLKKVISEEFTRRHYLKRSKVTNADPSAPTQYELTWGQRAKLEFKRSEIVSFVKDIYQMPESTIWLHIDRRAANDDEIREKLISGAVSLPQEDLLEEDQSDNEGNRTSSGRELRSGTARGRGRGRGARGRGTDRTIAEESDQEPERAVNGTSDDDEAPANARGKRGRGRGRQRIASSDEEAESPEPARARGRGRGRKPANSGGSDRNATTDEEAESPVRGRGRGRGRKSSRDSTASNGSHATTSRPRGRPRKSTR